MTEFKPGDKVISPLLVGEWEYRYMNPEESLARVNNRDVSIWVPPSTLSLVAPSLPPEPPVGSVVFVDGEGFVNRGGVTPWYSLHRAGAQWADIAATARPAVPKPTVDEVLDALHAAQHDKHATNLSLGVALHAALWPEVPE